MLQRKRMADLLHWKESGRNALLVDGARQVGKTSLIQEFIKGFRRSIEIDFTKNAQALSLLLEIQNYDDFMTRLAVIDPTPLQDKDDILFFDEIQYYYEARAERIKKDPGFAKKYVDILTLAKDIVGKNGFRLILSGSLLGTTVFSVNLNPNGFVDVLTMFPMDFEEYLLASGIKQELIDGVGECFASKTPVSDSLHDLFLQKFREYVLVGGFPAAVDGYLKDRGFTATETALQTIDNWYRADIIKYASKEDRLVILEMYNLLPAEISKKNRKFIKTHLTEIPNFKNLDLRDRFLWLKIAGIAIPTYNVTNPVYPLQISQDSKLVKLFFGDVGLLTHCLFDREAKRKLVIDHTGVDFGAVYENIAAQLLLAHGYTPYFHSTVKRGEVDFLIERNMTAIPIEIKSSVPETRTGKFSHQALDHVLEAHKEMKEAWVFGLTNVHQESERVHVFPIYMIDFVRKA